MVPSFALMFGSLHPEARSSLHISLLLLALSQCVHFASAGPRDLSPRLSRLTLGSGMVPMWQLFPEWRAQVLRLATAEGTPSDKVTILFLAIFHLDLLKPNLRRRHRLFPVAAAPEDVISELRQELHPPEDSHVRFSTSRSVTAC